MPLVSLKMTHSRALVLLVSRGSHSRWFIILVSHAGCFWVLRMMGSCHQSTLNGGFTKGRISVDRLTLSKFFKMFEHKVVPQKLILHNSIGLHKFVPYLSNDFQVNKIRQKSSYFFHYAESGKLPFCYIYMCNSSTLGDSVTTAKS